MNIVKSESGLAGRFFRAAFFIVLFGAAFAARAQEQGSSETPKTNGNYRVGIGDVLQMTVVKQPLLSVDAVRVGNDGTIRLPMLDNDIPAACLTEAELAAEIADRYKKYLLNPQVYVAVKEFNANPVALVGAVMTPGRFQIQRPVSLLELLTFVNGPAPNAGKFVQIIRSTTAPRCRENRLERIENGSHTADGAQEIISLPLAEVMKGVESVNPFLQAGDVVRVVEAEVEQAFVIGSVRAATTVNLKEPVTLSKAIAMAGGTAPGANLEKVKISRQIPNSLNKSEIIVNLKEIGKSNQEDILLQPNDIVDVPGRSGARKLLKDVFRTVVPVMTGVPIIIP